MIGANDSSETSNINSQKGNEIPIEVNSTVSKGNEKQVHSEFREENSCFKHKGIFNRKCEWRPCLQILWRQTMFRWSP